MTRMLKRLCPVFGLAMVATCLGCYSNWFLKRVDGYLWRWRPSSLPIIYIYHIQSVTLKSISCHAHHHNAQVLLLVSYNSSGLCGTSGDPLYSLSQIRFEKTMLSYQVTQSFLPRVARPTPSSSEALKLSSTESNSGTTRVGKTEGKRSKAK